MAKETQNDFLKEMGAQLAEIHKSQMGKKTEYGRAELPAGINNGIARLKEVKLGKYANDIQDVDKRGKWYFMATATVLEPKELDVGDGVMVRCVNGTTQIGPEPLCNTPNAQGKRKTVADHYEWVLNEVRMLLNEKEQTWGISELPAKIALLNKVKPCFMFRTWKGKKATTGPFAGKEPRVQHEWLGYVKHEQKVDQTALLKQAPSKNGHDGEEGQDDEESGEVFDEISGASGDGAAEFSLDTATLDDLEKVIELCKEGVTDAVEALKRLGAEVGVSEEQIDNTNYWEDAEELIKTAAEMPAEPEKPAQKVEVKVGNVYRYTPKGKGAKEGQYEILNLSKDRKICKLRSMVTKKELDGVAVDQLKPS